MDGTLNPDTKAKDMAYFGLPREDASHGDSSSDSEYQHALEVVFGPESSHRRRSSLAPSEAQEIARKQAEKPKTSCIVHSLLESHRQNRDRRQLSDIEENKTPRRESWDQAGINEVANSVKDEKVMHSRLLTKKQLSQMAMGVRDLSKKLKSLKVKLNIRTVFLITKVHDDSLMPITRDLTRWLLSRDRDAPYIVFVQETLKDDALFDVKGLLAEDESYTHRLKYWDEGIARKHPHSFDFVITLGGDGTVLYASWLFQRVVPPILSFALGSLGFLTKFDFEQYQSTLTRAFKEGVTVSLRLRFEATVMRSQHHYKRTGAKADLVEELIGEECEDDRTHKPDRTFEILNEIVVDRGPNPTMSSTELFGDSSHFTTVQADGLIVATPTGSTAYNLAAGGSLCHPENPVILVSAICAHTLSFRPIILPDTIVLRVGVPYDARTGSWASFDGRERVELDRGDYVTISASRYPFANVMPDDSRSGRGGKGRGDEWIQSISTKLQWNSRQRQKPFGEEGTAAGATSATAAGDGAAGAGDAEEEDDRPADKAGLGVGSGDLGGGIGEHWA